MGILDAADTVAIVREGRVLQHESCDNSLQQLKVRHRFIDMIISV